MLLNTLKSVVVVACSFHAFMSPEIWALFYCRHIVSDNIHQSKPKECLRLQFIETVWYDTCYLI